MGLLETLARQALDAFTHPNQANHAGEQAMNAASGSSSNWTQVLAEIIGGAGNANGALGGLIQSFEAQGLSHVMASWISKGTNLPITPEQIQAVLGNEQIQAFAQRMGFSSSDVTQQLAKMLPQAIDHLTPDGHVPEGDLLSQAVSIFNAFTQNNHPKA